MQWINQYSALLLLLIPLAAFVSWLTGRHRYPTARWLLFALAISSTAAVFYVLAQFRTGDAGTSAGQVESVLHDQAAGQPVLVELYSDY